MSIPVGEKAHNMQACMDHASCPFKTVVKALFSSNRTAGYAEAIELLEEMYGGSNHLHNEIYQDIKRMQPVQDSRGCISWVLSDL